MLDTQDANTEFVDFWNEILVPKFIKYRHILVGGLTHHSAKVFPSLEVGEGDRVLDVGCGFGDMAIQLARRVGPSGSVLGLDCCGRFLDIARDDAAAAGADNVDFIEGDAQTYPFEPEYDFCFSRFGTQFFENPVAGLKNMRRALKPGGTMTMIVWRVIEDNPWLGRPKEVVMRFLPPPGEDARTCGPGPFSMASQDQVTRQLEIAGYSDTASSASMPRSWWAGRPRTPSNSSLPWDPRVRSTARQARRRSAGTARSRRRCWKSSAATPAPRASSWTRAPGRSPPATPYRSARRGPARDHPKGPLDGPRRGPFVRTG